MTALSAALTDYLAVRRSLGCKLVTAEGLLRQFVSYCDERDIAVITSDAAVAWAILPAGGSAVWWDIRLSAVRPFARWLQSLDPATQVPERGAFGRAQARPATPYIYSAADIRALMDAAGTLYRPMSRITYRTLVGVLAITGMRIGEAIGLDRDDVDWEERVLRVKNSKFGKSRMLVLHPSAMTALATYASERDRLRPTPRSSSFFIGCAGTRLFHSTVTVHFHELIRRAGLQPQAGRGRPRVHDLRHTFAVTTLRDWHAAGVDVQARLPILSTYMGHVKPKDTYWYLSATPELLAAAAERLAAHDQGQAK